MWQSLRYSNLFLRLTLAFVFLWFGADKFVHPDYWLTAWIPAWVVHFGSLIGLSSHGVVYGLGIFEILVSISLAGNLFIGFFAILASIFLAAIPLFQGFNEIAVRDIGLIGALLALAFWPRNRGTKGFR